MKLVRSLGLLAAVLVFSPFAFADGNPVNMQFTGVNGANDGYYYVSPYTGTMNGQNVVLFCDDIKNDIYIGETWTANVTNLGAALSTLSGFANTRYGGAPGSPVSNPALAYQEAAWLVSQFATNTNDLVSLQYALWDIMNPGSEPTSYGDVSTWLYKAGLASNYSKINASSFLIVTNVGPLQLTGQQQEFIVQTPEPASYALILCGALALAILTIFRARLLA